MLLKDLLEVLDGIAPFDTAEPWDNTGLMVGDTLREVRSVLVALDPSTEVIHEAEKLGADLIITHHPLIFTPLKALRIGKVEQPCSLYAWAASLPFETVRIVDGGRPVKTVCACPGSGMDYLDEAIGRGCDTLVTGDVRYHAGLDAKEAGINVVDLGHFATEEIIIAPLAKRLGSLLPDVTVRAYGARDVFMQIKGENH